ncbi:hypothetical protein V500_07481 [Pseudogymnoascus sp. VKM F-4518 (FW-2643)]|nr:hypothetical protein V500_07481 [Pseudogymnoascus sp. VKM F-4518 (FW-2643)]
MNSYSKCSCYPHPENGSIRAILVANSTTRLYTHPLEWKASHLENLSFRLHHLPRHLEPRNVAEPIPTFPFRPELQWKDVCGAVADIQTCRRRPERDDQMRNLVAELATAMTGTRIQNGHLAFEYARRPEAEISLPLIFSNQQQPTSSPVWAYIDETDSFRQRRDFHRKRKRPFRHITRALQEPRTLSIDPLYVAILIALGQKARGARESGVSKIPQEVYLFVPEHANTSLPGKHRRLVTTLHLYTATITEEYLLEFDDPYQFHGGGCMDSAPSCRPDWIGFLSATGSMPKRELAPCRKVATWEPRGSESPQAQTKRFKQDRKTRRCIQEAVRGDSILAGLVRFLVYSHDEGALEEMGLELSEDMLGSIMSVSEANARHGRIFRSMDRDSGPVEGAIEELVTELTTDPDKAAAKAPDRLQAVERKAAAKKALRGGHAVGGKADGGSDGGYRFIL